MAGSIKGITIQIGADTTKLSSALAAANSSIRQTQTELRQVERALKFDPGNAALLSDKMNLLKEKTESARQKLDALKQAQAKLDAAGVDKNSEQYRKLQREIDIAEANVKQLEGATKNFGSVGAQQVAAVGSAMQSIGGALSSAGRTLTTHVTVPLVAVGAAGVKSFAEVDKTMQLTNKTMGNSAEEAQLLNQAMKDAAANSTFGMNDAATATLNFARAGLDATQASAALAPAMNLAAGEGGNLDTVSAGLVGTVNAFGDSFDNTSHYADVFAAACNNSALDVDSLSSAMSVAAPIFSSAGYSVNDAALFMGIMANNGIDANVAANSLKTGLARLVSPAKEGADMMAQLGISVTNADGTMKDSVTIQKELHDAFGQLSESEQLAAASAIFGKNQMTPWLALINTAPGDVNNLSGALSDCEGTTKDMADAMMSGFGGSLEKLKSSIDVAKTSLGEALAPAITKVADVIQKLVDKFNSLDDKQKQTIATIGLVVAAIGPILMVVGSVITKIGMLLTFAPAITTAFGAVSGFFTATLIPAISGLLAPIGAAIAAFAPFIAIGAAVVAAGVLIYKNWDTIKGKASELAAAVKEKFEAIKASISEKLEAAKQVVSTVLSAVQQFFSEKLNSVKTTVSTALENVRNFFQTKLDAVKNLVSTVLTAVFNFFKEKLNNIKTTVSTILEAVRSFFQSKLDSIKNTVSTILENIRSFFQTKLEAVKNLVTSIMESVRSAFQTKMDALKDKAESILNAVKDKFESVFNGIKSFLTPIIDWLKGIFNFEWKLPEIKLPHFSLEGKFDLEAGTVPHLSVSWYDQGGIFTHPSVIGVGEKRPEFVGALDDLRAIVREESGFGESNQLLAQMVGLLSELVDRPMGVTVQQTINAQETSYAQQQRLAAREFRAIARELR